MLKIKDNKKNRDWRKEQKKEGEKIASWCCEDKGKNKKRIKNVEEKMQRTKGERKKEEKQNQAWNSLDKREEQIQIQHKIFISVRIKRESLKKITI